MKEYIELESVMKAFADYVWNSNHSDLVPAPQWNHAVDIVRDFPAADVVEVRHGKWIHREDFDYVDDKKVKHWHGMCDQCGLIHDFLDCHTGQYNFCPNCGAKMMEV